MSDATFRSGHQGGFIANFHGYDYSQTGMFIAMPPAPPQYSLADATGPTAGGTTSGTPATLTLHVPQAELSTDYYYSILMLHNPATPQLRIDLSATYDATASIHIGGYLSGTWRYFYATIHLDALDPTPYFAAPAPYYRYRLRIELTAYSPSRTQTDSATLAIALQ